MSQQSGPPLRFLMIIGAAFIIVVIVGASFVFIKPPAQKMTLIIDKKAPYFTAVDEFNNNVSLDNYTGKVLMIDFIYTHCPNPNGTNGECSTETANMNTLLTLLQQKGYTSNDFHFISVSIDWKFDNVTTMYNYGYDRAEHQFQYWSFLSGNEQQINNITSGYDVVAQYDNTTINNTTVPVITTQPSVNNSIEYMTHSVEAYLIDRNGYIRMYKDSSGQIFPITTSNWNPKDILKQMVTLLNEK